MTQRLTLRRPDDMHLHLRDGAMLQGVLPESARHFARALVMPNLVPPVVTAAQALAYRDRILAALPEGADFTPLMTLYLTEDSDPDDVEAAAAFGLVKAVKLYPAGATTNSHAGVRDFEKLRAVLDRMSEIDLPLCVHGEVATPQVDIFDREAVFIETVMEPLRQSNPALRIVMEHITAADTVGYVQSQNDRVGATITPHHLILTRNHLLAGACARTTTACRSPSARKTGRPCAPRSSAATNGSFSAPTAPRMSMPQRKAPAAVPDALPRPTRWRCWRMCLTSLAVCTIWKPSPACAVLRFIACPPTKPA